MLSWQWLPTRFGQWLERSLIAVLWAFAFVLLQQLTVIMTPGASASMCEHQPTLSSTCSHAHTSVYCSLCLLQQATQRAGGDKLRLYENTAL